MKKNKEKEERTEKIKKITTIGCPSFDKFSASEQKAAFSTLLLFITEYYKNRDKTTKDDF